MRISIVGKIIMVLIFVSLIGGISAGPALARNGDRPGQRGWSDDRGRHDNRGRNWDRGRRPYGYYRPGPVYGPPIYPVPVPSPGVSLFLPFPFDIR